MENLKKMLTEICNTAWEQINKLEELRINIAEDLNNKDNTIKIDSNLLEMTKDSKDISLKPDPLRIPKEYVLKDNFIRIIKRFYYNVNYPIIIDINHNNKIWTFILILGTHNSLVY